MMPYVLPACSWRMWERSARSLLMWGAFVALALFYMIPVSAVQVRCSTQFTLVFKWLWD